MINKIPMLLLFVGLAILPRLGFARIGGIDSGGGKGVRCGSHVQTLDLFEARQLGLSMKRSAGVFESDLKYFGTIAAIYLGTSAPIDDIESFSEVTLNTLKQQVVDKFSDIEPGTVLPPTSDATVDRTLIPVDCEIVQIAIFDDRRDVVFRDRARRNGVLNSDEIRSVVGKLFLLKPIEPIFLPVWKAATVLSCNIPFVDEADLPNSSIFYLLDQGDENHPSVGVHVQSVGSYYVSARTVGTIAGTSVSRFFSESVETQITITNSITGATWDMEVVKDSMQEGNSASIGVRINRHGEFSSTKFSKGTCRLNAQ